MTDHAETYLETLERRRAALELLLDGDDLPDTAAEVLAGRLSSTDALIRDQPIETAADAAVKLRAVLYGVESGVAHVSDIRALDQVRAFLDR